MRSIFSLPSTVKKPFMYWRPQSCVSLIFSRLDVFSPQPHGSWGLCCCWTTSGQSRVSPRVTFALAPSFMATKECRYYVCRQIERLLPHPGWRTWSLQREGISLKLESRQAAEKVEDLWFSSLWCLGHASPFSCHVLIESVGCHLGTGGVSPRRRCAAPRLEDADHEQETHGPQGCCSNFMALHGPVETQPRRGNESLPAGVGQSLLQPTYEKTLFMDSYLRETRLHRNNEPMGCLWQMPNLWVTNLLKYTKQLDGGCADRSLVSSPRQSTSSWLEKLSEVHWVFAGRQKDDM